MEFKLNKIDTDIRKKMQEEIKENKEATKIDISMLSNIKKK